MTSITIAAQAKARCGIIISDSAVTNPDGTLQRIAGKVVYSVSGLPWALGVTGNVMAEVLFAPMSKASPRTLKQLFKRLPEVMRRAIAITAEAQRKPASELFLMVKGMAWDFKRNRPVGFTAQSNAGRVLLATGRDMEMAPFGVYEMPWMLGTHEPADLLLGRPVDLLDPASFDPEHDGLALVTQHRLRGVIDLTPGCEPGHCRIGGEVHLTEVRKTGVQIFEIGRFPDRIGRPIDPKTPAVVDLC